MDRWADGQKNMDRSRSDGYVGPKKVEHSSVDSNERKEPHNAQSVDKESPELCPSSYMDPPNNPPTAEHFTLADSTASIQMEEPFAEDVQIDEARAHIIRIAPTPERNELFEGVFEAVKKLPTDMFLFVKGESIAVHEIIISAASPFFKQDQKACGDYLLEKDPSVVKLIVSWVYEGKVEMTLAEAEAGLPLLNKLRMWSLCEQIVLILRELMDQKNCFRYLQLASDANDMEFKTRCKRYALVNFPSLDVLGESGFRDLDVNLLCELLKDEWLHVQEEQHAVAAALYWVKVNENERKKHTKEILRCLRLDLLDDFYIKSFLLKERFIKSEEETRGFLQNVRLYKNHGPQPQKLELHKEGEREFNGKDTCFLGLGADSPGLCKQMYITSMYSNFETRSFENLKEFQDGVCSVLCGKRFYIVSLGQDMDEIWYLDVTSALLYKLGHLEIARKYQTMAAIKDEKVYVLGGICPQTGNILTSVEMIKSNNSSKEGELAKAVASACCSTIGNNIYVFGGYEEGDLATSYVQKYDILNGQSTLLKQLCHPGKHLQCVAAEDRSIIILGKNSAQVYTPHDQSCDPCDKDLAPRVSHFGLVLEEEDGLITILGGKDENGTVSPVIKSRMISDFFSHDISSSAWRNVGSLPEPLWFLPSTCVATLSTE